MARPRFQGTAKQLAEVLTPCVTGVLWCRYPEDGSVDGAQLKHHSELLVRLRDLQQNLSFRDGRVKD
eukprot:6266949-Alexandrium_andersonii.AAC.1